MDGKWRPSYSILYIFHSVFEADVISSDYVFLWCSEFAVSYLSLTFSNLKVEAVEAKKDVAGSDWITVANGKNKLGWLCA